MRHVPTLALLACGERYAPHERQAHVRPTLQATFSRKPNPPALSRRSFSSTAMSDQIGRITVPTVINSGQTFPLTTQYPFGFSLERPVIVHRFGSLGAKQEQRYYVGIGPHKFQFKGPSLTASAARCRRNAARKRRCRYDSRSPMSGASRPVPQADACTDERARPRSRRSIGFARLTLDW